MDENGEVVFSEEDLNSEGIFVSSDENYLTQELMGLMGLETNPDDVDRTEVTSPFGNRTNVTLSGAAGVNNEHPDMTIFDTGLELTHSGSNSNEEHTSIREGSSSPPQNDVEIFSGDQNVNPKRRKRARPYEWKRKQNQVSRMKGRNFVGFQKLNTGKQTQDVQRIGRKIGPACASIKCLRSKIRFCSNFTSEIRREIFNHFWENMSWDQKKVYVASLVDKVEPKQRTTNSSVVKKAASYVYTLKLGDEKKRVCRAMFLSTIGIKQWCVRSWIHKSFGGMHVSVENSATIRREKSRQSLEPLNEKKRFLKQFLETLPKMPSHYCRRDTRKLYLEPIINSNADLYRIYKENCVENGRHAMSRFSVNTMLGELNISLFQPKKDQCDVCCAFKVGNLSDIEYNSHIQRKDQAREEKSKDKSNAVLGKCIVLTMDLESVKLSPNLKASALYFKMKLAVHNFTVYNLDSHHCTCYWWNEVEADLVTSTYATCTVNYLEENCFHKKLPVILFSDGCTYQNRNAIMSNALLRASQKHDVVIIQKFLEKGHTQMECDSVHSAIESRLRNRDIHTPSDYVSVCKEARKKPEPYEVKYLTHDKFVDYSVPKSQSYPSIRPGDSKGDPKVVDLRGIKYEPTGKMFYKLNHNEEWKDFPRKPKTNVQAVLPPLYKGQLPVTRKKWQDLQDLKFVLPSDCHGFYDTLPHTD